MVKRTRRTQRGAGVLTDQQWFTPDVLPPASVFAAPSTNPTFTEIRPVLLAQAGAGKHRRGRQRGAGVLTDQQWFNPDVLPPASVFAAPSTNPTATEIRPVLLSQAGAGRTRRMRGGFVPSIMGPFAANAQAAIVPAALYLVYHTMVPKNMGSKVGGIMKRLTRRMRKN